MCNAWNHSRNCTCGWGGEGHLGKRSAPIVEETQRFVPFFKQDFVSFTNPNAKCPVCSASVFFYQSPDGGRVFFDDLGPPWPKHGCTNNSKPFVKPVLPEKHWRNNGWQPFFIEAVGKIFSDVVQFIGTYDGEHAEIYVYSRSESLLERLKTSCLFAKRESESLLQISFLDTQGHEQSGFAAFSVLAARERPLSEIYRPQPKVPSVPSNKRSSNKKPQKVRKPKMMAGTLGETSMALAFKEAKERKSN